MTALVERGDISFWFRPTVQEADALETKLGVQSFFFVLSPERGVHRRVRVGRKRMPSPARERFWARVERVGSLQRVLADQLADDFYTTKTRGERFQPAARAIAQGTYSFVQHDDHVHLLYRIDNYEFDALDEVRPGEAMSHIVLFERVPRGRAVWTTEGDPSLLDEEGYEFVLVGNSPHDDVAHYMQPSQ